MSGVTAAGMGGMASVLGASFLPGNGPVGEASRAALAFTGFACGVYVAFALSLVLLGAALRFWGTRKETAK